MPDLVSTEINRAPIPEATFVRPMETSARDALRRFSNHSHRSFAQSTRSLAYANTPAAQSITTSRVPSVRPTLYTANPDPADFDEVMDVAVDTGIPIGYETNIGGTGVKRSKSRSFVGNLFRGFRKIPNALRPAGRPRKGTEATDATHYTGNTLPVYMATPPIPILPPPAQSRPSTQRRGAHSEYSIPTSLQPADGVYPSRNPSFQVTPPPEDADADRARIEERLDPTLINFPEPTLPDQTTYTDAGTAIPLPSSPAGPARSFVSERQDTFTLHPPRATSTQHDDDPVSVQAHPQPSEDYRRMSKTYTGTKRSSTTTMSTSEPSFDSERNKAVGFFSKMRSMPWMATDRVTIDYRPGLSHGSWAWKRVSVYSSRSSSLFQGLGRKRSRYSRRSGGDVDANRKKRFSFRPVQKSLASWYTDRTGKSAGGIQEGTLPGWALPLAPYKEDVIDLLSSGAGSSASGSRTRSSMFSGSGAVTDISSPGITPISPRSNYRRRSQRSYPQQPVHSTPHPRERQLPRTRRSDEAPQPPELLLSRRHSERRPYHRRSDRPHRRQHREQTRSPPPTVRRPATPYHRYATPSPEHPSSPVVTGAVPIVVPQSSMYLFQPSVVPGVPPQSAEAEHHEVGSRAPSPTNHAANTSIPQSAPLPLVYMPFISGQMLQHPGGGRLASVSEVSNEGTPPGLAGRGAFGVGSPHPSST